VMGATAVPVLTRGANMDEHLWALVAMAAINTVGSIILGYLRYRALVYHDKQFNGYHEPARRPPPPTSPLV